MGRRVITTEFKYCLSAFINCKEALDKKSQCHCTSHSIKSHSKDANIEIHNIQIQKPNEITEI